MFSNGNSGVIGGVSLIITVIGLIATLWGLRVTYLQLIRATTATEEVKKKADSLWKQVSFFDSSLDLTRADKSLDQIIALRRSREISLLISPLEESQAIFIKLARTVQDDNSFAEQMRVDAEFFLHQIQAAEDSLAKNLGFDSIELTVRCRRAKANITNKLIDFQKEIYSG